MDKIIDVDTGEVKAGRKKEILKVSAIGSCIVIAAYSRKKKLGVMAHVMLPGKSPKKNVRQRTRYAEDAIDKIIKTMDRLKVRHDEIEVCLVGAANVLEDKGDTVCRTNIDSVIGLLNEKNIKISAKSLGGTKRRAISFDIGKGCVFCSEGDEADKLLWKANTEAQNV
jgi:chemotaxis protein CheD